jgi:hypothetical protein
MIRCEGKDCGKQEERASMAHSIGWVDLRTGCQRRILCPSCYAEYLRDRNEELEIEKLEKLEKKVFKIVNQR